MARPCRGAEGLPVPIPDGNPEPKVELELSEIRWEGNVALAKDGSGNWHPLTLDHALQREATRLIERAHPRRGGVIAIDVREKSIVAWSEWPRPKSADRSLLLSHLAPSASLFKVVTTAALLEQSRISPQHRVCTSGGNHRLEQRNLVAPVTGRASCITFFRALSISRNAAYAQLVTRYLAADDLANYADQFGFNTLAPFEARVLLGRAAIPSEPLALARASTGFVATSLSALGAAYLALIVANGGQAPRLHLIVPPNQERDMPKSPGEASRRAIGPITADTLRRMMELTVRNGTATRAFYDRAGRPYLPSISVAAKTGTLGNSEGTTSWFIAFAPSRRPRIVVAVLLENGKVWRESAKQVGRDVLRCYFAADGRRGVSSPFTDVGG